MSIYNISFETIDPKGDIKSPLGLRFRFEPRGIIPLIADKLFVLREDVKSEIKRVKNKTGKAT